MSNMLTAHGYHSEAHHEVVYGVSRALPGRPVGAAVDGSAVQLRFGHLRRVADHIVGLRAAAAAEAQSMVSTSVQARELTRCIIFLGMPWYEISRCSRTFAVWGRVHHTIRLAI